MLAGCATPKELAEPAPVPVTAQPANPPCNFHDKALDYLAQEWQEAPIAVGVTDQGALIEVLATNDGDTWTIIVTDPNGWSCMVADGEGWRMVLRTPDMAL